MNWFTKLFKGESDTHPDDFVVTLSAPTVKSTGIDPKDNVEVVESTPFTSENIPETIGEPVREFLKLVEKNPARFKGRKDSSHAFSHMGKTWYYSITDKQTGEAFAANVTWHGYDLRSQNGPEWMTRDEIEYSIAFISHVLDSHDLKKNNRVTKRRRARERDRLMKIYKGD